MLALTLYMLTITAPPSPCHVVGPRLDGTYVTICQGTAVAVRDTRGNSRAWNPTTRAITVRAPGARPLVLEAAPGLSSRVD